MQEMDDRGKMLKQRMKLRGLKAIEVSRECRWSIDSIRKLGIQKFADETLDEIEEAIAAASRKKIQLQSVG